MADSSFTAVRCDPPPYVAVEYIDGYGASSDGRWLAAMRFPGNANDIHDVVTGHMRSTIGGMWIKRWWQWGARRATDFHSYYRDMDSPIVRCLEELGYEPGNCMILDLLQATRFPEWPPSLAELIEFARPRGCIYLSANWK